LAQYVSNWSFIMQRLFLKIAVIFFCAVLSVSAFAGSFSDDQKKEMDVKSGVLIDDVAGAVRGNAQPGDVILSVIQRGQSVEAKTAAQVNDMLGKLDKGASVTLQLKRGENTFFSTLRVPNGD